MSSLTLEGLSKRYGTATGVERVDLEVGHGELVALLGPSGCGKTTTLRMIAGFVEPTTGRILIDGQDITALPPQARDTAMVFQSYALFPHMTVAANVAFGLEMRKVPAAERGRRVGEALRKVRMETFADRMPQQLSGGQQQRVALARALVVNPSVLLLDEPLSNLDAKLRQDVRTKIRNLQQELGLTTLIVTHDQEEAIAMADRLVVMEGGRVRQIGTAEDLYERPVDAFVAGFVGRCNLVPGTAEGNDGFRPAGADLLVPCHNEHRISGECLFALRPENLRIAEAGAPGWPASFLDITYLGASTECRVDLGGAPVMSILQSSAMPAFLKTARRGERVSVHWETAAARLIPRST